MQWNGKIISEKFYRDGHKGNRIWSGARITELEGLQNVAFIRDQIDHVADYFTEGEIAEIWITFSDPLFLEIATLAAG